ncbi:MAG TPA: glycerate kinase [Egibacteraceae bacterium]|nr:glycerate kinase [Egibacteraceae bacterium]
MKVVIAPDKFAGTLTAAEAARAMAAGWAQARPGDEIAIAAMADGGEGTVDVVQAADPACRRLTEEVADARGRAVKADWLLLADGRALIECAQACGLSRLAPDERDPKLATTYGVGQLLLAAAAHDPVEIVVGLGGSATVDGGMGMATALGHRLLRADGNGLKVGGQSGRDLDRVEPAILSLPPVAAATDVTNPLLGPDGAAAVYGPQKGASSEDVELLEESLGRLADVVERDAPGGPWRDLPGAGAAGGLGFGLSAFAGARLMGGAATVARLVGLDAALRGADVVLTGEGSLDAQSGAGKAPWYVLELARATGARALAVAGRIADGAGQRFDAAADLGPHGMRRAEALVAERTARLASQLRT